MTDELASRDALRELLFDDVAPPSGSEAMFAATFAATGSEGADLLPPDDLLDDPALDDGTEDLPVDDPALDDPGADTGADTAEVHEDLQADAEHHVDWSDPTPDHTADPTHHGDPDTGW